MKTKAIIFDFFQVICNPIYREWIVENLDDPEGDRPKFLKIFEQGDRGIIDYQAILDELARGSGIEAAKVRQQITDNEVINIPLMAMIGKLHEKYKTALLSNAAASQLDGILERHGLNSYFDEIIISSNTGFIKPEPEIYHLTLKQLAVSPEEAIFIDDNPGNVAASMNVGIDGIVFTTTAKLEADLRQREII